MMKTILFTLVGSVAANTTTAAPSANCEPIGASMVQLGSAVSGDCCTAAGISITRAVIADPNLPASTKATVTSCHAPTAVGGCETTGSFANVLPVDAAGMWAGGVICGNSQACGTLILNGLGGNTAALNGALKLGMDPNSDGVVDLCASLAAAAAAAAATTTTTTTTTTEVLGTSAAASLGSAAAMIGAAGVALLAF